MNPEYPKKTEHFGDFQKAFFDQQKFTDQEADDIEMSNQEYGEKNFQKALMELYRSQDVKDYMEIPSENPKLNEKTVSHEQMTSYDHSLEKNRWKMIGGKDTDDDGIEINMDESQDHQK